MKNFKKNQKLQVILKNGARAFGTFKKWDNDGCLRINETIGIEAYFWPDNIKAVYVVEEFPDEDFGRACLCTDNISGKCDEKGIYIEKNRDTDKTYPHRIRVDDNVSVYTRRKVEFIGDEPAIEITVKVDGKEGKLKDISEETLLNIKRMADEA